MIFKDVDRIMTSNTTFDFSTIQVDSDLLLDLRTRRLDCSISDLISRLDITNRRIRTVDSHHVVSY